MQAQTRDNKGNLKFFDDVKSAFDYAEANRDVWKVSFGEARWVRNFISGMSYWYYEPIMVAVERELQNL